MELASTFGNPLLKDYILDSTYDEMFTGDGLVRPHYGAVLETFLTFRRRKSRAASGRLTCLSSPRASPSTCTGTGKGRRESFLMTCCRA